MQQIANIKDIELIERQHARAGRFKFYALVHGDDQTPGNFYLQLSRTYSDFFSPRHRHNFEQIRCQVEGTVSFGRDGTMSPGTIGYFPEGVYYGPQNIGGESYTLVLQFGGASLSGYMSEDTFQAAMTEMKAFGTFEKGAFRVPKPDGGSKNRDAYEAVWEHVNGRKLKYPGSRYDKPLFMDPASFNWASTASPGVQSKHLGTFSEGRTEVALFRLDAGAMLNIAPNTVIFALNGKGTVDGTEWETHCAMYSGANPGAVTAIKTSEVLCVVLPHLPEDVGAFLQTHPDIRVDLHEHFSAIIIHPATTRSQDRFR